MKQCLTRSYKLYHFINGKRIEGAHDKIRGNVNGITGDVSKIRGDVSGILGNVSGIRGDISGIAGNIDDCWITDDERKTGIKIEDLILNESKKN